MMHPEDRERFIPCPDYVPYEERPHRDRRYVQVANRRRIVARAWEEAGDDPRDYELFGSAM